MQKVPYVQRIKRKDGRVDLYFRKGDFREGPLSSPDGSEELQAEVEAILKRIEKAEAARVPKAGTVGGMLKAYNKSAEFLALARSTQKEYQRLIDELDADCGDIHLREIDTAWLRDMRDAWAVRGYKAANDRMQVLKNALSDAVDDGRIDPDPFAKVKKARRPHETPEAPSNGSSRASPAPSRSAAGVGSGAGPSAASRSTPAPPATTIMAFRTIACTGSPRSGRCWPTSARILA